MGYEDKCVEDCLKEIKKEMRSIELEKNNEYRINKNKTGNFRIHLLKLFHLAFKEGVYVGKAKV